MLFYTIISDYMVILACHLTERLFWVLLSLFDVYAHHCPLLVRSEACPTLCTHVQSSLSALQQESSVQKVCRGKKRLNWWSYTWKLTAHTCTGELITIISLERQRNHSFVVMLHHKEMRAVDPQNFSGNYYVSLFINPSLVVVWWCSVTAPGLLLIKKRNFNYFWAPQA